MGLKADYENFVRDLKKAAGDLFFGGETPTAFGGMEISTLVNVDGSNMDGQLHIDEHNKCYVQITKTVRYAGHQQPLLTKFAIAHEFGHIVAGEIGGRIGTAAVSLQSKKHEVAADLIGTVLLLRTGITPIMITTMLNEHGAFIMDDHAVGTHPARKDRVAMITTLFPKIRSGGTSAPTDAIAEILTRVT